MFLFEKSGVLVQRGRLRMMVCFYFLNCLARGGELTRACVRLII
jgi:hypothetical protein